MNKKIKDIFSNQWTIAVFGGGLGGYLSILITQIVKQISFIDSIKLILSAIISFFKAILFFKVFIWIIIILDIIFILIYFGVLKYRKPKSITNLPRQDLVWFLELCDKEHDKMSFLYWFPIYETKTSTSLNFKIDIYQKIRNNLFIQELENHNIIKFNESSTSEMELNQEAYNHLMTRKEWFCIGIFESSFKDLYDLITLNDFVTVLLVSISPKRNNY